MQTAYRKPDRESATPLSTDPTPSCTAPCTGLHTPRRSTASRPHTQIPLPQDGNHQHDNPSNPPHPRQSSCRCSLRSQPSSEALRITLHPRPPTGSGKLGCSLLSRLEFGSYSMSGESVITNQQPFLTILRMQNAAMRNGESEATKDSNSELCFCSRGRNRGYFVIPLVASGISWKEEGGKRWRKEEVVFRESSEL